MMHGQLDGVVTAANPMGRWIPFADAKLTRDAWVSRNGWPGGAGKVVWDFWKGLK